MTSSIWRRRSPNAIACPRPMPRLAAPCGWPRIAGPVVQMARARLQLAEVRRLPERTVPSGHDRERGAAVRQGQPLSALRALRVAHRGPRPHESARSARAGAADVVRRARRRGDAERRRAHRARGLRSRRLRYGTQEVYRKRWRCASGRMPSTGARVIRPRFPTHWPIMRTCSSGSAGRTRPIRCCQSSRQASPQGTEAYVGRARRAVFLRAFAAATSLRCGEALRLLARVRTAAGWHGLDVGAGAGHRVILQGATRAVVASRWDRPRRGSDSTTVAERNYWLAAGALYSGHAAAASTSAAVGLTKLGAVPNDELRWRLAALAAAAAQAAGGAVSAACGAGDRERKLRPAEDGVWSGVPEVRNTGGYR